MLFAEHRVKIVVDDGSTDATTEKAKGAGADIVVTHRARRGLAQTFASGIATGLTIGADIIVNIDADGQYEPEQIAKLIEPIAAGKADVVLGSLP
jgi:glycosyltransferase involved in cell wall biosynthesis